LNEKELADGGVTDEEAGTALMEPTVTVEIEAGMPVHAPLLKKKYVTLPVTPADGKPPVRVAWSVTDPPTVIVEDGMMVVVIVGVCLLTVKGSHVLLTLLLLPSPL